MANARHEAAQDRLVGVVRAAFHAFAVRDLRRLHRLFDDEITASWSFAGVSGQVTGREALLDVLARLVNDTAGTARAEPVDLYPSGPGQLIVLQTESASFGTHEHRANAVLVVDFTAERISAIRHCTSAAS